MYVFPGGRVDGDDHLHKYDAYRHGPTEAQAPQVKALGDEWRGFWIAAIRETFEEAGLLLAYDQNGDMISFADEALRLLLFYFGKNLLQNLFQTSYLHQYSQEVFSTIISSKGLSSIEQYPTFLS